MPLDGIEWLNADSEWRDETARGARPRAARLPGATGGGAGVAARSAGLNAGQVGRARAARRRIVALPAHDAHGGLGEENGDSRGPAAARAVVRGDVPDLLGARDAGRRRRAATPPATPRSCSRRFATGAVVHGDRRHCRAGCARLPRAGRRTRSSPMGGRCRRLRGTVTFTVRADVPPRARRRRCSGTARWSPSVPGERSNTTAAEPGSYRVEIHGPRRAGHAPVPWLVSNPIYWFRPAPAAPRVPCLDAAVALPLAAGAWRTEHSPGSTAIGDARGAAVALRVSRSPAGDAASQFAALVRDLAATPRIHRGRVQRPAPRGRCGSRRSCGSRRTAISRWRKSFYVDTVGRPSQDRRSTSCGRPTRPARAPPISRASSLLFVVDLTNAVPGAEGVSPSATWPSCADCGWPRQLDGRTGARMSHGSQGVRS